MQDPPLPTVIIGAGPLGLATAIAMHLRGQTVALLDARPATTSFDDKRILALSHGSRQLLEALGAWPQGASPIKTIHVSQRGALGRTVMQAAEHRLPALGYVLPASLLQQTLMQRAADLGVSVEFDTRAISCDATEAGVTLKCRVKEVEVSHQAALVLCCEGSIADDTADTITHDYAQYALLARVTSAQAHDGTAWERFTPEGPIALLPLGADFALVWTVSAERLAMLMELGEREFLDALQVAFGPRRMQFSAVRDRASYPLRLRYRQETVGTRQVWLGNAAQTLHPVAGQGFNLALRDAWELADTLSGATDPGAASLLAQYAARRQQDRRGAIGFTDSLVRLFSNDHPLLTHARGVGLLALDVFPPLRHFVARRMLFGARAWP